MVTDVSASSPSNLSSVYFFIELQVSLLSLHSCVGGTFLLRSANPSHLRVLFEFCWTPWINGLLFFLDPAHGKAPQIV